MVQGSGGSRKKSERSEREEGGGVCRDVVVVVKLAEM